MVRGPQRRQDILRFVLESPTDGHDCGQDLT